MGENEGKKEKYQQGRWVGCDQEQQYFGDERKVSKVERKKRQAQDRSKYKKSDQQKQAKEDPSSNIVAEGKLRGRVLSIQSRGILVENESKEYLCTLRGALKKEKSSFKNLITVGDFVHFELLADQEGVIAAIEPRHSILSRADNLSRRKQQLIAANIDQVLITVSVITPLLKPPLVDRYIIAAMKGKMAPVVLVNKIDLLEKNTTDDPRFLEQSELYKAFIEAYAQSAIPVIAISVETGEGMEQLRAVMKDKASVFSGQSGVGKSSLINKITNLNLPVGETVAQTRKGAHTTTTAQLIPLEFGGWCIDTPGIKSFGVWDLQADEIEGYYEEIHQRGLTCKFPNCTHTHESDCAVKTAVESGEIAPLRYSSYLSLLETVDDVHKRR